MRRVLLLSGLALLVLGALAPALEAFAACSGQCIDEGPGSDCADDQCCSCCVHPRLVTTDGASSSEPLSRSSLMHAARPAFPPPAEPGEILHVPKPALA